MPWKRGSASSSPGPISTSLSVSPGRMPSRSISASPSPPPSRQIRCASSPTVSTTASDGAASRTPSRGEQRALRGEARRMRHRDPVAEHPRVGDGERHARARLAQEELGGAARRAEHVHEADGGAVRARSARGVGGELLHEALRPPVEARGERRLVGGRDDDGVHAGRVRGAQDVPAADEVRVDELLRVALGPVDVLVGGEVEDHVGPGRGRSRARRGPRRGRRRARGALRSSVAASRERRSAVSAASLVSSTVTRSGRKPSRKVESAVPIEPAPPVSSTRRPPKSSCSSSTAGTGSRRRSTRCHAKPSRRDAARRS